MCQDGTHEDKTNAMVMCKEAKREVKKAIAQAKEKLYEELYRELNSKEEGGG